MSKHNNSIDDCRTRHDIIGYCERNEAGLIQRNGGSTVYVVTAAGAEQLHDDDKTLSKAERSRILEGLREIGAIVLVLLIAGAVLAALLLASGALPVAAALAG